MGKGRGSGGWSEYASRGWGYIGQYMNRSCILCGIAGYFEDFPQLRLIEVLKGFVCILIADVRLRGGM